MQSRAQTSVELLIVLAVSLAILGVLIQFTVDQVAFLQHENAIRTAQQTMKELVLAIDRAYAQGPGTVRQLEVTWPAGLDATTATLSGRSIVVRLYGTDVSGTASTTVSGTLPTTPGTASIRIRSYATYVELGSNRLSPSVTSVYIPVAQDSNATRRITISNLSEEAATYSVSLPWPHTVVTRSVSPASGSVAADDAFSIDLNVAAASSAGGNYVGTLTVTGTYPSFNETLTIPVNVEVYPVSSSLLRTVPTSLGFSTYGIDSNTATVSVCNDGSTALTNIAFIPSVGNVGDWVQDINSLSSLAGGACTDVNVSLTSTTSTPGTYTGSILLRDEGGGNTAVLPLTVSVVGASSFFSWNWSTATVGASTISGITLTNTGDQNLTLSTITISNWWTCDTNHSLLTQMDRGAGNTVIFSGTLQDGNVADITDFSIAADANTTLKLTFEGPISDENEPFLPQVTFSDGTTYTGAQFGGGCIADVTPPAQVTTLVASPGGEPGSVALNFLFSGDDNYSGKPTRADFRYSICSDINAATVYDVQHAKVLSIPFSIPLGSGLSSGALTVSDLNVGYPFYFTGIFYDEVDNNSGIPLVFNAMPHATFSVAGNDFNFANFPFADASATDINYFVLSNFVVSSGDKNVVIRIAEDTNAAHSWIMALRFRGSNVGNIRIWYPGGAGPGIPNTTPTYERALNLTPPMDVLSATWIPSEYKYGGTNVEMSGDNHLYLDLFSGFSDMNIKVDSSVATATCHV